ncbi:hypothetical protein ACSBR1_023442 [Camellia fascicularis]
MWRGLVSKKREANCLVHTLFRLTSCVGIVMQYWNTTLGPTSTSNKMTTHTACIDEFNHCCPLLFLDTTFLKGRFKGFLLAATAKDGNQVASEFLANAHP